MFLLIQKKWVYKFFSNLWSQFFSPKKTNQCYIYQSVIKNLKSWKRFSYICNFKFWQHSVGFRSERRETFRTLKYQSIFINQSLKLKFAIRIRKKTPLRYIFKSSFNDFSSEITNQTYWIFCMFMQFVNTNCRRICYLIFSLNLL